MRRPTVLLLSGSTGAGHAMAARAIEEELVAARLPVLHLDAYRFVSPAMRWASTDLHRGLSAFLPRAYGQLYRFVNASESMAGTSRFFAAGSRNAFARALLQLQPRVVLTTHALGCLLAGPLASRLGFRLVVLTTDYYAHAFHRHADVDAYCTSHPWTMEDLRSAGVPQGRLHLTGIPLRQRFDHLPDTIAARQQLGLAPDRPVVLLTRGGMAAGPETVALLDTLLRARELASCTFVAILGHRSREYEYLATRFSRVGRLRLERFVDDPELFLAAADIVIGKAGGLSSTETFAMGRPLILYAPNAGVEAPNVARFVTAGAAINADRSPQEVVVALRDLLAFPARRHALATAGKTLIRPGSRQAVRMVVERLAREPAPVTVSR